MRTRNRRPTESTGARTNNGVETRTAQRASTKENEQPGMTTVDYAPLLADLRRRRDKLVADLDVSIRTIENINHKRQSAGERKEGAIAKC